MLAISGELNPSTEYLRVRDGQEVATNRAKRGRHVSVYEPDPLPEQRHCRSLYQSGSGV